MGHTDTRVKLMNEVLNGIRIIKYYAWENAFVKKIASVRAKEIAILKFIGYLFNGTFAILLLGAPQTQTVLIFLTYIGLGNELDSATAFTTLTLFGLMTSPFIFLPFGLQQYSQSLVSMKRIIEYLDAEDLTVYSTPLPPALSAADENDDIIVKFDHANFAWANEATAKILPDVTTTNGGSKNAAIAAEEARAAEDVKKGQPKYLPVPLADTKKGITVANISETKDIEAVEVAENNGPNRAIHTLVDLNLTVNRNQLVAIVGTVGSGKSSFFAAILGEMLLQSGTLGMKKDLKIAYCDQRPWIVNATVKENILFGKEYDEAKLNAAVEAAAMHDDLKILEAGLLTEIGERGINLSGGQKARVCLARAVYNDADLYLLDDPLSAVDAHVGDHIFRQCIKENLKNKTVLLVTHHLHVLPQCDLIVILDDNGSILVSGTYTEILNSGIDVEKYLAVKKKESEDEEEETDAVDRTDVVVIEGKEGESTTDGIVGKKRSGSASNSNRDRASSNSTRKDKSNKADGKLMSKEERNMGDVPMEAYWSYVTFGGTFVFFLTMFTQFITQVLQVVGNFRLVDWGDETTRYEYVLNESMPRSRSFFWFNGYAGLLMASIFTLFLSRMFLTYHRTEASVNFHNKILSRVLYFPVAFFDVTPIGRIINRFSQDMQTVDEDLAQSMSQVISMFGSVLGTIGAIAGSTKGVFLILLVPLSVLYRYFNIYFRKSNTAIARLEAISRSPIYADFSQTISGTSTIRAYGQSDRFIANLERFANNNTIPGVLQQVASQWLSIRLDFLGAIIQFFMGCLAVSSAKINFIPAGYLALGLSYSIQLTALLKMAVRVTATMEAQFNAVERIRHYAINIPIEEEEKPLVLEELASKTFAEGDVEMAMIAKVKTEIIHPPADWPSAGKVEFFDAKMRYREGPLVLKGISFTAEAGDKVGIAGRTGCGKSSLMVALFRIEELVAGRIVIDGIDISQIPLNTLRSKLCIIPQDPVMFSASVRFNLDPFDECTDEQVWDVLRDVNMKDHIMSLPNKLEELVAEGGDNFSAGQRQLICIGRAILRKPKILIMDEATASIDAETDNFIQRMIRTKFKPCTVLTIAHRLHTIIDSTKVLVLDGGHVAEYESPETLLSREDGMFKKLWDRHVSEGGLTGVNIN